MEKLNTENKSLIEKLNEYEDEIYKLEKERFSMGSEITEGYLEMKKWEKEANEWEHEYEILEQDCDMWQRRYRKWKDKTKIIRDENTELRQWYINIEVKKRKWKDKTKHERNEKAMANYWRKSLKRRYRKWKDKELNSRQIILNLRNNINLQNQNMAQPVAPTLQDVTNSLSPLLAEIPKYKGQEPPDDYINNIEQVFVYGATLNVAGFDDAVKTSIL
jgi:myosin heavy subunit